MALVPWVYNNPRTVNADRQSSKQFLFQGKVVEVLQVPDAAIDVTQNTALRLWDGAFLLSRYLENSVAFPANFWHGLRCIELGAGCGLVGLVAWLLGADVTLTDLPSAVSHTRRCVDVNVSRLVDADPVLAARKQSIRVKDYSWGDRSTEICSGYCPYDVILGSDIVYSADLADCLVDALRTLSSSETLTLLSYKQRGLGEEIFFEKLVSNQFKYETVSRDFHAKDFNNSDYEIFRISQ